MNNYIITSIIILFISLILYLIFSGIYNETFTNDLSPELIPFEMRIPNDPNINTIVNNNIDNTGVLIIPQDKKSNFPLDTNSMNIEEPKIVYTEPKPNEAFKDNRYIRDEGLTNAMKKVGSNTANEYKELINVVGDYKIPISSNDKLSFKSYDDVKNKNMYIHEMYNEMSAKLNEDISKEELERIMGKPIEREELKNMYNPVYSNINIKDIMLDMDYKYKGYENVGYGSVL